jgi:hypothetical protein
MSSASSFVPSDGSQSLANDRRALMAELGMPPDAAWKRLFEPGDWWGPRWAGWTIDNFGMSAEPPTEWPPPWPYLLIRAPEVRASVLIQVWRSIVQPPGCPLSLERRWHPERGEQIDIRGLERKYTNRDIDLTRQGIELLGLAARERRSESETKESAMMRIVGWAKIWLQRHPSATMEDLEWSDIDEVSQMSWNRLYALKSEHKILMGDVRRHLRSQARKAE